MFIITGMVMVEDTSVYQRGVGDLYFSKTDGTLYCRRWDGDFLTVKKLVQDGKLGRVAEMEIHFDRLRNFSKPNWREGDSPASGVFYNLGKDN